MIRKLKITELNRLSTSEFKEIDNIVNVTLNNGKEIVRISIKKSIVEKTTNQYSFSKIKMGTIHL